LSVIKWVLSEIDKESEVDKWYTQAKRYTTH
jgi:hypothetical protein